MKFSITIPTYKSRYLKEAIESVVSQTYTDWELIIVDDCSPEDLPSIVQPFLTDSRIRFYRNEKTAELSTSWIIGTSASAIALATMSSVWATMTVCFPVAWLNTRNSFLTTLD